MSRSYGGTLRDVDAVQQDAALGRLLESGDHPQAVVFPDPDGPSIEKNSPCADVEVHPVHGDRSPKRLWTPSSRTASVASAFDSATVSVAGRVTATSARLVPRDEPSPLGGQR